MTTHLSCFNFSHKAAASIGELADVSGMRPSALFEWNDPTDWPGRLKFDMYIIGEMISMRNEVAEAARDK